MRSILKQRPSAAMVVALLALFVALGGSATAAFVVTGQAIKNGTVTGEDLKNRTLGKKKLSKRVLRALRGAPGLSGAPGPAGPQGAQGPKGDPGPPGPSSAKTFRRANGPLQVAASGNYTTVATATGLQGENVITAKTSLNAAAGASTYCRLAGPGDVKLDDSVGYYGTGSFSWAVQVLQASVDLGTGGPVRLQCRGNASWSAIDASINAIQVESVANTEVTG